MELDPKFDYNTLSEEELQVLFDQQKVQIAVKKAQYDADKIEALVNAGLSESAAYIIVTGILPG